MRLEAVTVQEFEKALTTPNPQPPTPCPVTYAEAKGGLVVHRSVQGALLPLMYNSLDTPSKGQFLGWGSLYLVVNFEHVDLHDLNAMILLPVVAARSAPEAMAGDHDSQADQLGRMHRCGKGTKRKR